MPADTKAGLYEWFMTDDEFARIVKFRWIPERDKIESSMTLGTLTFEIRDELDDEWVVLMRDGEECRWELPWVVAQSMARNQGFNVEVCYPAKVRRSDDLPPPTSMTTPQS
jgi:hypothetical protein